MAEWEYRISVEKDPLTGDQSTTANFERALNKHGESGWELASGFQSTANQDSVVLIFKREKSMVDLALLKELMAYRFEVAVTARWPSRVTSGHQGHKPSHMMGTTYLSSGWEERTA